MNTIAYLKACAQPFDSEQYHNEDSQYMERELKE